MTKSALSVHACNLLTTVLLLLIFVISCAAPTINQPITATATAQLPRKPNIILIVADDLGYAELSVQGCKDAPTPHIDSLARNGVRFTQGYVTCPVCAPTRAGLMAGRYQQRFGFENNPGPQGRADESYGLPRSEKTLAERLKPLGYATGMVGKWHLGFKPELMPTQRGFDEFFGFLGGANQYFPNARRETIYRGMNKVEETEYLTDAFAREALVFIDKHKQQPFFLYLAFNAVHSPLQAPEKYLSRCADIKDEKRRTFAAMKMALDDSVGKVLDALERSQLTGNTLVFFLSDNGGPTRQTTSSNVPFRGFKGQVYEGGIRVACLVKWPGHIPAGKAYDKPVISLDIVPTVLAAAGMSVPSEWKLDGINLLPYLNGEKKDAPHENLYWRFVNQSAIRQGDWKMLVTSGASKPELFNLAADSSESLNLANKLPEKIKALTSAWQQWNAQLQSPKWIRKAGSTQALTKSGDRSATESLGSARTGAGARQQEKRFQQLDRNGDGKITPDEMPRRQNFERRDVNGDGVITLDEWQSTAANPAKKPKKKN